MREAERQRKGKHEQRQVECLNLALFDEEIAVVFRLDTKTAVFLLFLGV